MKKIEAIIRTSKFEEVKAELKENGIIFFSYWEVSGIGNEQMKVHHTYRGTVFDTQYVPRIFISIVLKLVTVQEVRRPLKVRGIEFKPFIYQNL